MSMLRELPEYATRWNRAHRGAFIKGQLARSAGAPRNANPYSDNRKLDGRLTWSRAFMACWDDGYSWQTDFRHAAFNVPLVTGHSQ
jgi:hypothetical protein